MGDIGMIVNCDNCGQELSLDYSNRLGNNIFCKECAGKPKEPSNDLSKCTIDQILKMLDHAYELGVEYMTFMQSGNVDQAKRVHEKLEAMKEGTIQWN